MLIKALCDYSALQENKTPAGYCKQAIHFEILLTPEGKIAAINDLRVPRIIPLKNKKTKTASCKNAEAGHRQKHDRTQTTLHIRSEL